MAGHFHYRGAHDGFQPPRDHPHHHRGLYLFAFVLVAILAFAWTGQSVDQLLPIPSP
jgi:hypothetical protein